ncbi:DnaD domain protein [Vagococcus silagei]|uniref:DnaD domain protein n=2 Tax=Vagococcus silagei TaxID=2508885 RepID=A0A4S3B1P6_9ENTE|nr:DnaD domain protein [Vagococcus silagei]
MKGRFISMLDLQQYLAKGQTSLSNLVLDYYKKIGMTDAELLVYLQLLKYQQKGNAFPELSKLAKNLAYPLEQVFPLIESLIAKKIIKIETVTNKEGQAEDWYNLNVIYETLSIYLEQVAKKKKTQESEATVADLFKSFESEFGRALSPVQYEEIQKWLNEDQYSPEIIQLALREAVLNQAYSFTYIDRILLDWERKNLKSKQDVQRYQKVRQNKKNEVEETEEVLPHIPLYNWLDSE